MKHGTVTERYLRRSTRGLWGKKRLEVKEELAAHLHERVLAHRIAGLGETDAVEKALSELGEPKEVSVGMAKLYTLPALTGSGLILAAATVLALSTWTQTAAQGVKSIFYLPTKACVRALEPDSELSIPQACNSIGYDVWLERQELSRALRDQGVTVKGEQRLSLGFPGSQPVHVRSGAPGRPKYNVKPADPSYVSLWELMRDVRESQPQLSLTGWNNPRVHFGGVTVQVGSDARPVPGDTFYQAYLSAYVSNDVARVVFQEPNAKVLMLVPRTDLQAEDDGVTKQTLEVIAKPGEVYGVIVVLDPRLLAKWSQGSTGPDAAWFANLTSVLSMDVAQVEKSSTLELFLPEEPVRFVTSLQTQPEPGTAILVRLAGSDTARGYEAVPAEQVRYKIRNYGAHKP